MTGESTKIGLGYTSGMRFIGIQPPLTDVEIARLTATGAVRPGQIEQVTLEPACTLVRYSTAIYTGEVATRRVLEAADAIGGFLSPLRGEVQLDTAVLPLTGHQSSPFNPNTDR
jgi:hypothetical protein